MVSAAIERWDAIDILHNNVGIESRRTLLEVTEEEWDQVMTVDLKSMLLATQAAARPMVERGRGSIICVSSVAAMRGHGRTAGGDEHLGWAGADGFSRGRKLDPCTFLYWSCHRHRAIIAAMVGVRSGQNEARVEAVMPKRSWAGLAQ